MKRGGAEVRRGKGKSHSLPADKVTGCIAKCNIFREIERFTPVDDFAVGVVRILGTEGRPADETFEHDCANGPPIAAECIPFSGEDFRGDVIRCSDCRVRHDATGFAPCVDLTTVADGEVYLIKVDRCTVVFGFGG